MTTVSALLVMPRLASAHCYSVLVLQKWCFLFLLCPVFSHDCRPPSCAVREAVLFLATERIVRLGMTLTPEGRKVFAGLTIDENLRLGAAARKDRAEVTKTRAEIFELFPILKERLHQFAGTLSGGEQQQLAIAR